MAALNALLMPLIVSSVTDDGDDIDEGDDIDDGDDIDHVGENVGNDVHDGHDDDDDDGVASLEGREVG